MSAPPKKPVQSVHEHAGDLLSNLETRQTLMKAGEVAKLLALSGTQIYRLIEAGRMPCVRIGQSVRIDPQVLARWLRDQAA